MDPRLPGLVQETNVGRAGWDPPHPQFRFYCRRQSGAREIQPSRMGTDGDRSAWSQRQKYHTGSPHVHTGSIPKLAQKLDFEL